MTGLTLVIGALVLLLLGEIAEQRGALHFWEERREEERREDMRRGGDTRPQTRAQAGGKTPEAKNPPQ